MAHDGDIADTATGIETVGARRPADLQTCLAHLRRDLRAQATVLCFREPSGALLERRHGAGRADTHPDGPTLEALVAEAVKGRQGVIAIENLRQAPPDSVAERLAARGVAAILTAPLHDGDGVVSGVVAALATRPRRWRPEDANVIGACALALDCAMALREAEATQADILRELFEVNEALSRQSAELSMARVTAETALKRQTSFLAGLSHELRTPLNGVLGGLSLLNGTDDATARGRYQKMIRASAKTLGECVDDLLTYCRLGAGIEEPDIDAFDPRRVVEEAVESGGAMATEKGLSLEAQVDRDTPAEWRNDGRRLVKLLVNLLGNAVKYTQQGGVTLRVTPAGDALAFRVTDTGRGVPSALHEAIFEPFNRGDPETARSAQGTGLGLAIARETAHRLGGALMLERSAPGAGSTFLLTVPWREAAPAAGDALFD